jgi:hypothetical protein
MKRLMLLLVMCGASLYAVPKPWKTKTTQATRVQAKKAQADDLSLRTLRELKEARRQWDYRHPKHKFPFKYNHIDPQDIDAAIARKENEEALMQRREQDLFSSSSEGLL